MALNKRLFLALAAAVFSSALILTTVMAAEPSRPARETSDANSTAYKAGETAGSAWQSGKEAVRKAWDSTKETARNVWHSGKETAREGWTTGKETAKGAWDTTKEKTGEVTREVKDGFKDGQK